MEVLVCGLILAFSVHFYQLISSPIRIITMREVVKLCPFLLSVITILRKATGLVAKQKSGLPLINALFYSESWDS